MAPASVSQNLKIWISALSGSPAGNEDRLISVVRKRLNTKYEGFGSAAIAAAAFAYGTEPIVRYLLKSVPEVHSKKYSAEEFSEHVHDAFRIIAMRTRLPKKFGDVLDSAETWSKVQQLHGQARRGVALFAPTASEVNSDPAPAWSPPQEPAAPWWAKRYAFSGLVALLSAAVFQTRPFFETGQRRLLVASASLILGVVSFFFVNRGPDELPEFLWKKKGNDAVSFDTDDGESEVSTQAEEEGRLADEGEAVQPDRADDVAVLRREMASEMSEIRKLLTTPGARPAGVPEAAGGLGATASGASGPSGSMAALANFVQNTPQDGFISQTAARMAAEQAATGRPEVPASYEPVPGSGWAPFSGAARLQTQAAAVRRALMEREAGKATNPWWANLFWHDVDDIERSGTFEADLRRVLAAAGYLGPGTVGAPRGALRAQLDSLISTGAPPHGAGIAAAASPQPQQWLANAVHGDQQFENQLPPELPRAAPEIYRSCRSAGASSIRMWMDRHYEGSRDPTSARWKEMWNTASRVDFAVSRCRDAQELTQLLATNDDIEIDMRVLAAEEYLARTGDQVGADQMLAIKAPGVGMDLAPEWLVNQVTTYSRNDHQRREHVASGIQLRGRGRGRDRGRGRGRDHQHEAGGKGAALTAEGGGGRGRGGRRGRGAGRG